MMTIAPMHDADGDLVGYVSSHWDISHQKELDRARTGFITNVSHELRTPLTNLRLYIDLVRRDAQSERTSRYLQVLEEQTKRLIELTEDVLEIAVWDSGQGITSWKPVSLSTVIEIVATSHRAQAETAGLTLVVTPPACNLGLTKGDEARLAQALDELVENAIRFTPDGGQVTIDGRSVNQAGQDWRTISVRDTGPGIPAEERARIFDRFYRGSLAEAGTISGTGLGLCIAQEIIRAHGGKLTVASEADGGGSTFTIWLPVAP
jgi:two-component system sensor histidine kinase VicK